jgi:hypothetical protein
MLSFRKPLLVVIGIGCILLLGQTAVADPIHPHCSTSQWNLTRSAPVEVTKPTPSPSPGPFEITLGGVQFDQLPPNVPGCSYETSDITSITATLNFASGSGRIEARIVNGFRFRGDALALFHPIPPDLIYTFDNGREVNPTIQFTLHSVGDAFHVIPGDLFGVNLSRIDFSQFPQGAVTATITARGNHYYVVPEPTTMLLFGTGLAGVATALRRKRKTHKSKDG